MNVAVGVKRLVVMMEHVDNLGRPKIVRQCSYPLTATRCVKTIYSDLAVIDVTPEGLLLREVAPGVSPEEVQAVTEPQLMVSPDVREMEF